MRKFGKEKGDFTHLRCARNAARADIRNFSY